MNPLREAVNPLHEAVNPLREAVSALLELADGAGLLLISVAWQVAVLALAVLLAVRLLGRWLTPRWRAALWSLVLLRALVPVVPIVPGSPIDWSLAERALEGSAARDGARSSAPPSSVPALAASSTPASPGARRTETGIAETGVIGTGSIELERESAGAQVGAASIDGAAPSYDSPPPDGEAEHPLAQVTRENGGSARAGRDEPSAAGPIRGAGSPRTPAEPEVPVPSAQAGAAVPAAATTGAGVFVAAIWLAGLAVFLLRALRCERAFRRRLAREARAADPALLALVEEARALIGLRLPVRVVQTELVASPAVTGVRRPRLLLPPRAGAGLDRDALLGVLLHELAHLRRGDVLRNAALTLVAGIYWFHPLVRLAARRLRAETEALRDREALAAHPAPNPVRYAETLIELLEAPRGARDPAPALGILSSGADIHRRIDMITSFDPSRRRPFAVGAALCLLLSIAAFTSASAPASTPEQRAPDDRTSTGALRRIEVERHLPRAAWRGTADEELAKPISIELEGAELGELVEFLRQSTALDFVVDQRLLDEGRYLDVSLAERPVSQVLDVVCGLAGGDLDWGLVREAVYLGYRGEIPESTELRFYEVDELVQGDEDLAAQLVDLVYVFSIYGWTAWEAQGVSLDYWDGLLVVRQTERVHAEVEAFLSRLLNRGAVPEQPAPAWAEGVAAALALRAPVSLHDVSLGQAAEHLSDLTGIPIVAEAGFAEDTVELELQHATIENALAFLAGQHGLHVAVEDGIVCITADLQLALEFYEVGDLWSLAADPDVLREQVESLIRETIDPASWDSDPRCAIHYWQDLMLVEQTPAAQAEIGALIEALRRALE